MQKFIARSPQTQKLVNLLKVSAPLPINILIEGEEGTGKETLVDDFFKNIPKLRAGDIKEKLSYDTVFLRDLQNASDIIGLMQKLKDTRIIAAATDHRELYEEYFPIILKIDPLAERPEDLEALKELYCKKAAREFELEDLRCDFVPDLSKNAISLKKSIYEKALLRSLNRERIEDILQEFLQEHIDEGYKELLAIFEVPLLRAAQKRYKSVLAMAKALKLNRATLTGKLKKYGLIE